MKRIELRILDQPACIRTDDSAVLDAISACYSAFLKPTQVTDLTPIELTVRRQQSGTEWSVTYNGNAEICQFLSDVIYVVEKSLTIELQLRRPDLFFLHAAAVSYNGQCIVISGESGAGKSTLCWDLCNAGLKYMSDELAPLRLDVLTVEAYPHAICLKHIAADMPALPKETVRTEATMHVPVEAIPGGVERTAPKIDMIVFLENANASAAPALSKVSQSEAAARLYSNGLNQLAHECDGLRAAAEIAGAVDCYTLVRGSLSDMRRDLLRTLGVADA